MHGLNTIRQLNDLAAQNAPGAPEAAIAAANARRNGHSPLHDAMSQTLEARKAAGVAVVDAVHGDACLG